MAIAIKKSSTSLTNEIQSQIASNTKLDTTDYSDKQPEAKRSDDVVQLKFSRGKRAEAKAFFASCDVKMNAGFEMAYEFIKEEVASGRIKLSKSGIQRVGQ